MRSLAAKTGYPAEDTLEARAAREKWSDARATFRRELDRKSQELALEPLLMVRERQATLGKSMQHTAAFALLKLQQRLQAGTEVLGPHAIAKLAQTGAELERRARGMEEFTVRTENLQTPADLESLSTDQLLEILQRVTARDMAQAVTTDASAQA